ncbi:Minor extracellular protease Epr [Bacillus subtilis subsp. subtilis]|nr:Minor extracellular protease Epr [Bacillus subtilis subsp. subtilis]
MKKAEKDKTKKSKASAQSAVNQLKASNEKTKLQKRLNAVKPKSNQKPLRLAFQVLKVFYILRTSHTTFFPSIVQAFHTIAIQP